MDFEEICDASIARVGSLPLPGWRKIPSFQIRSLLSRLNILLDGRPCTGLSERVILTFKHGTDWKIAMNVVPGSVDMKQTLLPAKFPSFPYLVSRFDCFAVVTSDRPSRSLN